MQRHTHMHMAATYFNIDGVEKMGCTTLKRAFNQTLMAKSKAILKLSCGSKEFPTPQREQNAKLRLRLIKNRK
jgi:hypothetical protein